MSNWTASLDLLLKNTQLLIFPVHPQSKYCHRSHYPLTGASLASIATCSPMEVRMITSVISNQKRSDATGLRLTSIFLLGAEEFLNLIADLTLRYLDVILSIAVVGHQGEESIIRDVKLQGHSDSKFASLGALAYELIFLAGDIGDIHVVGRRAKIFEFFASEDVNGDKMDLGMTVLASL